MRFVRVAFVLVFLPILLSAQSLRRENKEKENVVLGDQLLSYSEADIVPWSYDHTHEEWQKGRLWSTSALGNPCLGLLLDIEEIESLTIRKAVIGVDSFTVWTTTHTEGYYEYPELKEGFKTYVAFEWVVFNGKEHRAAMLEHLDKLDASSDANVGADVKTYTFDYVAAGGTTDFGKYDTFVEDVRTRAKKSYTTKHLSITMFPVKIDGVKSVRFVVEYPFKKNGARMSAKCFDEGYFEMSYDKFRSIIEAL